MGRAFRRLFNEPPKVIKRYSHGHFKGDGGGVVSGPGGPAVFCSIVMFYPSCCQPYIYLLDWVTALRTAVGKAHSHHCVW